jgi:hypothetical protein
MPAWVTNVTRIVRVAGAILDNDAQDTPDELDIGSERPERPEDRCEHSAWDVEPLAEHLYLHDYSRVPRS